MLGTNFIECDEHCGVDGARYVDKSAGDAFHARDAAFFKFRCGRGVGRVLRLGLIHRRKPFVGIVLRACGHGVLEALQGFADVVGNGDADVTVRVVPIDGESALLATRRVDGDRVILPECVDEVGGVVVGKEFDFKVIYSEGEGGR